jgi:hypothetical protein
MSVIYRKTVKGIDEAAFGGNGLPPRLVNYLLVVDGNNTIEVLQGANPHLPSMAIVCDGLREQGFLEVIQSGAAVAGQNVVSMPAMRVGNGAAMPQAPARPAMPPAVAQPPMARGPAMMGGYGQAGIGRSPEIEAIKSSMIHEVSQVLGTDASMVITKIQGCHTKDDLFATMMGIKKIITMYSGKPAADKFAARYQVLAS